MPAAKQRSESLLTALAVNATMWTRRAPSADRAAEAEDAPTLQKLLLELEAEWRKLEASLKGC